MGAARRFKPAEAYSATSILVLRILLFGSVSAHFKPAVSLAFALCHELTPASHADDELATGCEQLLHDEHCECCADGATDDSELGPVLIEDIEIGVATDPSLVAEGAILRLQAPDDVAVRIENADVRNDVGREAFLPARSRGGSSGVNVDGASLSLP